LQWKEGVALITGIGAKEIVASTMSVLYHGDISTSGMSSLSAFCFLIFVLLYMPCFATCIGIKNESGKWGWAIFTAFYTTLLAWLTSTFIYQIGSFITGAV
jgi:ferrous iron transport protein B